MDKINLFCLPFAGGNKYSYREYEEKAPSFFNMTCLEYPGRGKRIKEPFATDIHALVEDLYLQIKDNLEKGEYAIYGHSLGGIVGFLLTKKIIANNHRYPAHLFITGTSAPSAPSRESKHYHLLEKNEFFDAINKLDGLPREILLNEELMDFIEPILRSDFKLSETYLYEQSDPMNIPVTVITGTDEDIEPEDIRLWQNETMHKVDFRKMSGNHFFIFRHANAILQIISAKLITSLKQSFYGRNKNVS